MKPFCIPSQQINSSDTRNQEHEVVKKGLPQLIRVGPQLRGNEGNCILTDTVTTGGDVAEIQTGECSPRGRTTTIETATTCLNSHRFRASNRRHRVQEWLTGFPLRPKEHKANLNSTLHTNFVRPHPPNVSGWQPSQSQRRSALFFISAF